MNFEKKGFYEVIADVPNPKYSITGSHREIRGRYWKQEDAQLKRKEIIDNFECNIVYLNYVDLSTIK